MFGPLPCGNPSKVGLTGTVLAFIPGGGMFIEGPAESIDTFCGCELSSSGFRGRKSLARESIESKYESMS